MLNRTNAATKKVLAAFLVAGLSPTCALADDVTGYSRTIDWSGLFLGVQAGAGRGTSFQDITSPSTDISIDIDGAFIGGTMEYLWQVEGFVFGPQAEFAWASIDGDFPLGPTNHFKSHVDWFGSFGGKAGLAFENVLLFGTAGFAFGEISAGQSNTTIIPINRWDKEYNTGYSFGGGVDIMLQDGWVAGIEYRQYEFSGDGYFSGLPFQPRSMDTDFRTISFRLSKQL